MSYRKVSRLYMKYEKKITCSEIVMWINGGLQKLSKLNTLFLSNTLYYNIISPEYLLNMQLYFLWHANT